MAEVSFEQATRLYPGADRPAVNALDLRIDDGEFMVLVGPSGCGKSTSLRMLAGLEEITRGCIRIGERDVSGLPPKERDVAMVFQNYALYPHMTVAENMAFALKISKRPREEIRRRVEQAARMLDLTAYLDRKPKALSGGQRQRVAMGRAIVREPKAFLMDEPLSNLDAKLRTSTRSEIAALQRRLGVTTVYVTHDQTEAMTMGDRVAVLNDGVLAQCDTPVSLYQHPANAFVAGFIGSPQMNIHEFPVVDGAIAIGDYRTPLSRDELAGLADHSSVLVGFRPEAVELVGEGDGFAVTVRLIEDLGADAYLHGAPVALDGDDSFTMIARIDPGRAPTLGGRVNLRVKPGAHHLFLPTTGEAIPRP